MEAELRSISRTGRAPVVPAQHVCDEWQSVVFSVAQARGALKYVAAVASDAARAFNTARCCRRMLKETASRERRAALCDQRDLAIRQLDHAIDECNLVGAHLFDLE